MMPGTRPAVERAILGAIVQHGPADAAAVSRQGRSPIAFLDYDRSLNDVPPP
jgi:hypothetical protein